MRRLIDKLRSRGGGLEAPQGLQDLMSDLNRRGLKWVVVGLVGLIVAIPVIFAKSSPDVPAPAPSAGAITPGDVAKEPVSGSDQERRSAKLRGKVEGLHSGDPFRQIYDASTTPSSSGSGSGASGAPSGSAGATAGASSSSGAIKLPLPSGTSTTTATPASKPKPSGSGGSTRSDSYLSLNADLRLRAGDKIQRSRSTRPMTALPSDELPLLVYVGAAPSLKYATFVPAPGVAVTRGGTCYPSPSSCFFIRIRRGDTVRLEVGRGTPQSGSVEIRLVRVRTRSVSTHSARALASAVRRH